MSEISVLSNQYKAVVDTTDRVNNSIIALKKRSISFADKQSSSEKLKLSDEELEIAKEYLLHFLEFLKKIQNKNTIESEYLPSSVIKDFQTKVINSIPFFEDEIRGIIEIITTDKFLEKKQFNLLDKMASTLDTERTILFRKLRSARG